MVNEPPLLGRFFYGAAEKNRPTTGNPAKARRSTITMNPKKSK
jgi:hypothetical protein